MKKPETPDVYVAIFFVPVILIWMSLPWTEGVDLFSGPLNWVIVRGWNLIWFVIPALVAIGAYVYINIKKDQRIFQWVAGIAAILSLAAMFFFAILVLNGSVGVVMGPPMPEVGFWITALGFVGMTIMLAIRLFAKKTSAPAVALPDKSE